MKVVLINSSDKSGGAAVACTRLLHALHANGVQVSMLVKDKATNNELIESTTTTKFKKIINFYRFAFERLIFFFYERSKEVRFAFSIANTGEDISKHHLVKEADIIHLHWFNQGYLSIKDIHKLLALNKPMVWTLHDMWPFTGGCHYAGDCNAYQRTCNHCPYLKKPGIHDLSAKIFFLKQTLYQKQNITFVGCSEWMAETARKSELIQKFEIKSIPNPIDTKIYKSINQIEVRNRLHLPENKLLILFGAANIFDKRKGFDYLIKALRILIEEQPETKNSIELILFGKAQQNIDLAYKIHQMPYINAEEEIVLLYNAADLFVLPSLEDNLPNTVMESLACGTPVVAFSIGGLPEMIEHGKNGYLAQYRSSRDLANGIKWVINHKDRKSIKDYSVLKVLNNYSFNRISSCYTQLYNEIS
jgi:glycosyltransferase involved in cell wall biosynthesis